MGDLKSVIKRGTDAFNSRDEEAARAVMAENVRMRAPGMPELTGRDAAMQFDKVWWAACSDGHADDQVVAVDGNTVLVRGVFSGTHDGVLATPMGDIPATGTKLTGEYAWIFRVEDDLVTEAEILFDRLNIMEQLGLVPEPAAAGA